MQVIQVMNNIIDYIEQHICQEIDYESLAKIGCCSIYNIQRLFSYITGLSIVEYVRRRRLTLAAEKLCSGKGTVLDIANKYGYKSPESFARAFKAFHNITPSSVQKLGGKYQSFPRICYQMVGGGIPTGGEDAPLPAIVTQIVEKEAFWVLGIENKKSERIFDPNCSACWDEFYQAKADEAISPFRTESGYLGVFCSSDPGYWNYLIGAPVQEGCQPPRGMFLRKFPVMTYAVITHEPVPTRDQANRNIGRLVAYAHGGGWECPSGYERRFDPIMFVECYPQGEEGAYRVEIWLPLNKIQAEEDLYNALYHFSNMRASCVADLPEDLDLSEYNESEKEWIMRGLPEVRDQLLALYEGISLYAQQSFNYERTAALLARKGGVMQLNREARNYLDALFITLIRLLDFGVVDASGTSITVSKAVLKTIEPSWGQKFKFHASFLEQFSWICRVICWKGNLEADWKHCDTVEFVWDDPAVLYTWRQLVEYDKNFFYFQHGDYRRFSRSGRKKPLDRLPEGVIRRVLGQELFELWGEMHRRIHALFGDTAAWGGENLYQGYGDFGLIQRYDLSTKNYAYIDVITKSNWLMVSIHFDKNYFAGLPGIYRQLDPKIQEAILNLPKCMENESQCKEICKKARMAVFDADIYPDKVMYICHYTNINISIESASDIDRIIPLFKHLQTGMEWK